MDRIYMPPVPFFTQGRIGSTGGWGLDSPCWNQAAEPGNQMIFGLDVLWGPHPLKPDGGLMWFGFFKRKVLKRRLPKYIDSHDFAEPGAVGGKVSFLDALPPNVEAGKLRLWDVNQLTLWEVNVFSGVFKGSEIEDAVKVHSKEMVLPFKGPLDQRINDEQQ